MSLRTLPRLLRTLRSHRASQLLWRGRVVADRRLRRPRPAPSPDFAGGAVDVGRDFPDVPQLGRIGPAGETLVGELERGRYTNLHQRRDLGRERPDWRLGDVSTDRLWTITLHYHGWAASLAELAAREGPLADRAAALLAHYVADWIERCDVRVPGARALAWNSYSIATRIGWWIRAWLPLRARRPASWAALEPRFLGSLWQQAAWLEEHLEWDLRGNHLLRDLVGLAWAGRFFRDSAASRWSARAAALVPEQLAEQVLPDGAHFELSPTYHVQIMDDVLSLALLLEDPAVVALLGDTWRHMAGYLTWLRHPDGHVALLNDGGLEGPAQPAELLREGGRLGVAADAAIPRGGRHFPDAGLVVWHGEPWSVFFDVGPLGAPHVPAHGHADALTLECSHGGQRLFVDPGTYGYDADERRRYDRSTAAHNTVAIDGADSSELWHIFRAGRRARTFDVRADFGVGAFEAAAAHDGYAHRSGAPIHRRRVAVARDGKLLVEDSIGGRGRHRVSAGFLLDPAWNAVPNGAGWLLDGPAGRRLRVETRAEGAPLELALESAPYHPDYGVELSTRRLVWRANGRLPLTVRTQAGPP